MNYLRGAASLKGVRKLCESDLKEGDVTLAIISNHNPDKVEGQEIADLLRDKFPEIKIVSVGPDEKSNVGWADEHLASYNSIDKESLKVLEST